jgi:hypothetical protein
MTPITVRTTINLPDKVSNLEVAMIVGFANFSSGIISVKPTGGTMTTLFPKVDADTHYQLGPAAELISKDIRMILTGSVGDPKGAVKGSFHVKCDFFQKGKPAGSSDPVKGKYGEGEARQDFNIICSFT